MALAKQTVKAGKHIQIFVRSNGKIFLLTRIIRNVDTKTS